MAVLVLCSALVLSANQKLDPSRAAPATPTDAVGNSSVWPQASVVTNALLSSSTLTPDTVPAPVASTIIAPTSLPLIKKTGDLALAADGSKYQLRKYKALATPNDPSAIQPWVTNANVDKAWDIPRGPQPTLLAIIDTGVALQHEEFKNRWYTNPGETGPTTKENPSQLNCTDRHLPLDKSCNLIDNNGDGIVSNETGPTTLENPSRLNCTDRHLPLDKSCNMVDNDGNGLINDNHGWDFVHFDNAPQAGEENPSTTGGHHATYVTSVAAATGNNGAGIAGVDWGTTILPIQALGDEGSGDTAAVANAINYAASQHADVISLSLGSTTSDPLVRQAVQAAIAKGSIIVAAAGNDGCDCMNYPANYPEVVAVGASTNDGQLASFSSYGANLDITAPGVNLYTADWQPNNQTSAYASGISGTSLATPIVSGLLTRLKSLQPTASPLQLIAALTENTNRLTIPASVSRSDKTGFGMIDANKASQRLITPYSPASMYSITPLSMGQLVFPNAPSEVQSSGFPYHCNSGAPGTTPVYNLQKSSTSFYSASAAEIQRATDNGYVTNFFSFMCVTEPQDKPSNVYLTDRIINANKEFQNKAYDK